jgi:hypothetical protein
VTESPLTMSVQQARPLRVAMTSALYGFAEGAGY